MAIARMLVVFAALLSMTASARAAPVTCEDASRLVRFALEHHLEHRSTSPQLDRSTRERFLAELGEVPWLTAEDASRLASLPAPAGPTDVTSAFLAGDCSWFVARVEVARAALERAIRIGGDAATIGSWAPDRRPAVPPEPLSHPLAGPGAIRTALRNAVVIRAMQMGDAAQWRECVRASAELVLRSLREAATRTARAGPELATSALVRSLDHYSRWIPPGQERGGADGAESFGVILDNFGVVPQGLRVRTVIAGSPADHAGLRPGDVLLSVDGRSLAGLEFEDALAIYDRARDRSPIVVGRISGHRVASRYELQLVRAHIALAQGIPAASWHDVGDRRALVVRIDVIDSGTAEIVSALVARETARERPALVVLDLRASPGGDLDAAVATAGLFLDGGPVARTLRGDGSAQDHLDPSPWCVWNGPLAVLVSRETASSAELLTGALHARGRAMVLGDARTFGKATIQEVFRDAGPGTLLLTDGRFRLPDGTDSGDGGIVPDVVVPDEAPASDPSAGPDAGQRLKVLLGRALSAFDARRGSAGSE